MINQKQKFQPKSPKFEELNADQKNAFKDFLTTVINVKTQEEQKYVGEFWKLLIVGNGTGLFLVATLLGSLIGSEGESRRLLPLLITPLILFAIGACVAAFVYFPLFVVSSDATRVIGKQITDFYLNKITIEEITGWNLNRFGVVLVYALLFVSFTLFCIGAYKSVAGLIQFTKF